MKIPIIKKTTPGLIGADISLVEDMSRHSGLMFDSYSFDHRSSPREIIIRNEEEEAIYNYLLENNDVINEFRVIDKEMFTIDEFLKELYSLQRVTCNGKDIDVNEYILKEASWIENTYNPKISDFMKQHQVGDKIVYFDCITVSFNI